MDSPTPTCRRPTAPVHQTRITVVLTLIDIVELTGAESKCSIKLGDGFKADHANRGTRPEAPVANQAAANTRICNTRALVIVGRDCMVTTWASQARLAPT
jgi:hypothetical protein